MLRMFGYLFIFKTLSPMSINGNYRKFSTRCGFSPNRSFAMPCFRFKVLEGNKLEAKPKFRQYLYRDAGQHVPSFPNAKEQACRKSKADTANRF